MFGKNIKYYRLMKGLTQETLAAQLGVNSMTISNYENDKRTPDIATLRKLAAALNVPIGKLTESVDSNTDVVHGAFRKNSSMTKAAQEMILGYLDRYINRLFTIVSFLGVAALPPAPYFNRICVEGNDAASYEMAAGHLRQMLNLPLSGPVGNITDILENKGFIICPIPIDEHHFSGNSGMVGDRPYIAVNTTMTAERQRFTLIHELVHLAFTFPAGFNEEHVVDGIAGAFLLPADDIKRELGLYRHDILLGDLRLIQQEYAVSMASIIMRAHQCEIISEPTYKRTQIWLSESGLRRSEQSGMMAEESHLLRQLALRAVAEEDITMSRAAELLDMPIVEVRELCCGGV